jgi:hypothetical protein
MACDLDATCKIVDSSAQLAYLGGFLVKWPRFEGCYGAEQISTNRLYYGVCGRPEHVSLRGGRSECLRAIGLKA